jgi:hypothetical protein
MAGKSPMIKGPDIYIGGKQSKPKPRKRSWEADELGEINRYWKRPWLSQEGKRQSNVKRTSGKSNRRRQSQKV